MMGRQNFHIHLWWAAVLPTLRTTDFNDTLASLYNVGLTLFMFLEVCDNYLLVHVIRQMLVGQEHL